MLEVQIGEDAIRIGPRFAVVFQRTLRIPDDGHTYPLPPGLGRFPIRKVSDFAERVPASWDKNGTFIPIYQREALWLGFEGTDWKPNAVKIAAGGINVVSGDRMDDVLRGDPQDYLVCPDQPWIDGFNTGDGRIRQFVAMPLGRGYTIEGALTGAETVGGIQFLVFEPKPGRFPDEPPLRRGPASRGLAGLEAPSEDAEMGLGAGGQMKQRLYPDRHGLESWDRGQRGAAAVYLVNSADYLAITGDQPPPTPVDARAYAEAGLPWFDLYDEDRGDVPAAERLADARTIEQRDRELGEGT
ncbi:MAG: integral rane protein [Thermomicrobiales bacterium]|nr:integral rane protein [Thermomicrobiales bacterium]